MTSARAPEVKAPAPKTQRFETPEPQDESKEEHKPDIQRSPRKSHKDTINVTMVSKPKATAQKRKRKGMK